MGACDGVGDAMGASDGMWVGWVLVMVWGWDGCL